MTTAISTTTEIYLPSQKFDHAPIIDFMRAHQGKFGYAPPKNYFLTDPDSGEQISLPEDAMRALIQVISAMAEGKAVTVTPHTTTLTTQQAADILGVSRPTVVKLIDSGELRAEIPGARRRRILLPDLLEYRDRKRRAQLEAIMATSELSLEQDATPDEIRQIIKEVRAHRAAALKR